MPGSDRPRTSQRRLLSESAADSIWAAVWAPTPKPSKRGRRLGREAGEVLVWLYHRFCLSFRDVEDLLAQRGVTVTGRSTVSDLPTARCQRFGPVHARRLRRRRGRMGDTWHLDEVFVTIQGRQQYLWRAVAGGQ